MFVPIALFWDYISPFPWYLGPALQIAGMLCLWITRFTGRFYPKWGNRYYAFSAVIRPLGILLIAWGWLEIFSVQPELPTLEISTGTIFAVTLGAMALIALADRYLRAYFFISIVIGFIITIISYLMLNSLIPFTLLLLSIYLAVTSIMKLGLRRSFLYVKTDDPLITAGAYAHQRHPQFLAAVLSLACTMLLLGWNYNSAIRDFQALNFIIFFAGIYLIIIGEEKDLVKRFGEEYIEYKKATPRLFEPGMKTRPETLKLWKKIVLVVMFYVFSIAAFVLFVNSDKRIIYADSAWSWRRMNYEAKCSLASISTAQIAYFAETNQWGKTFETIEWAPAGVTRYAYFLNSCDEVFPNRNGFKECPPELKKYFETFPLISDEYDPDNPKTVKEGFHAAAASNFNISTGYPEEIWVIDQRKIPEQLSTVPEFYAEFQDFSKSKRYRIFKRRGRKH